MTIKSATSSILLISAGLFLAAAITLVAVLPHRSAGVTQVGHGYGIAAGSSLSDLSASQLATRLDGIKATGATWVRFDVSWDKIQPNNQASYDWSSYDPIFSGLKQRGLTPLGIIDYTPAWARSSDCSSSNKCHPANSGQFASFASAAASRYGPQGAHDWEIWNEPNNPNFWQPGANPAAYVDLLKKSATAIRAADKQAFIITGGLSPQATTAVADSPVDFTQALYLDGAKPYFDALADHPYTFPLSPSLTGNQAWSQMAGTGGLRQIMVQHGDASKKIWITEFGSPTGGPGPVASVQNSNLSQHPFVVDEGLQAQILSQALQLYRGYNWTGPFFVYSYQDAGNTPDTNENFFGLVRYDGSQKPAYQVFQQATAQ